MRLLFVGTGPGGGGIESHFVVLARAMAEAGHAVAAVVQAETPIHARLSRSPVRLYEGTFRNALDPRGLRAVWTVGSRFRPDWIIGSYSKEYWPLVALSRALGIRLALFRHMDFPMKFMTHNFIPRLADRFIVISEFMQRRMIARGISPRRIQLLYNPIELEQFKPRPDLRQTTRQALGVADGEVLVGYFGSLYREKGVFTLADAINQVMDRTPAIKALWVGEGPAGEELVTRTGGGPFASRHLHHRWVSDLRSEYAAIDILALPSTAPDTFGRVSIEAQACGVVVLGSDLGGIPETMVPNVTGFLLPPGDVAAWRDSILTLAGNRDLRAKMAEHGREWVGRTFGSEVIARRFSKILENGVTEIPAASVPDREPCAAVPAGWSGGAGEHSKRR